MSFGKIIFGDNQFLGINHASLAKASEMQDRFAQTSAIIEVLGWAYEAGLRDFMFTTHDRLEPVFREIVANKLFTDMNYIPCLPYAHKYANAYSEGNLVQVLTANLSACPKLSVVGGAARTLVGDLGGITQLLVEVELLMTRGLNVTGVFLQNVIFDLIIGLHGTRILERFHEFVEQRFNATPGYITINHPLAQQVLCDDIGLTKPWICSFFNVAGFRMHPSKDAVEKSFANGRSRNMAMSVFASGVLDAQASIDYVKSQPGVDAVLFGSSSHKNIVNNVKLLST
jgi:hypothetical protein